ncbi:glucoamylase family protein [Cytophagales bacterium LB-30]|uniref:Glucoamylase family protein n=1 Tax=Shiella aurantiaca TaxID=3058365 RepID=A0ABT8F8R0_9BACT|nr:glucoamylase family protein [Shiella aurantiaca]MDN4166634.1 glucoamylase family protein [Shiella aurantiaca]
MKHPVYILAFGLFLGTWACQPPKETAKEPSLSTLSDDSLLNLVQYQTFRYFYDGAEPTSGAAPERIHMDGDYPSNDQGVVTSGGTGFGIMAILVGIERGFISREEGVAHLQKLVNWLEKADRFHGAWPHWMYGETGKVKAFSPKDNGGDLVETSFLAQGLITARQYFQNGNEVEQALAKQMNDLVNGIEWTWYQNGKNVLYWHWSPEYAWEMNFPVEGYNECLIMYVMAAASPTYPIAPEVYHEGWARKGDIKNDSSHQQYGKHLALRHNYAKQYGGPLFWSHYSFLGLDPRQLKDRYANYWEHNVNHVKIDYDYCVKNPKGHAGYGAHCWGLTSSYSINGYAGHKPMDEDLGVISPTAALSSFPYTPEESMQFLRFLYAQERDSLIGDYGPYDAFSIGSSWYKPHYLAIDQGPIPVMIENHRSGLLWELFMSAPEVQQGLNKLGFTY